MKILTEASESRKLNYGLWRGTLLMLIISVIKPYINQGW